MRYLWRAKIRKSVQHWIPGLQVISPYRILGLLEELLLHVIDRHGENATAMVKSCVGGVEEAVGEQVVGDEGKSESATVDTFMQEDVQSTLRATQPVEREPQ